MTCSFVHLCVYMCVYVCVWVYVCACLHINYNYHFCSLPPYSIFMITLSSVLCPLTTGSTEGTVDEDKKNSPIPSYVNVELDDGSVPMTTNPGYMQVERMTEGPKPLYGNL